MTVRIAAIVALSIATSLASAQSTDRELSITDIAAQMKHGELTSRALVQQYLDRIAKIDKSGPAINAIIELHPDALAIAQAMDAERKHGKSRGPLHGVPVLIKDNIDTADKMHTSAGSLALANSIASKDSAVAEQLRKAGAVIIGKTNLSEWANFRSTRSSSGWSGRGGLTKNPYALDRNACGSSSGTGAGIAANLAAVGVGTETDGSIVCPSATNGIVGIKPTVGLISGRGIVPISHSQDTAGPMARTVADAAILLTALATDAAHRQDYAKSLDAKALHGARIGVIRKFADSNPDVKALYDQAVEAMRASGAILVDCELPNLGKYDDAENIVLQFEFKHDLNAYLACVARIIERAAHARRSDRFRQARRRARTALVRTGNIRAIAGARRSYRQGLSRRRRERETTRRQGRYRRGARGESFRCTHRADRRPGMDHRSRQWRSFRFVEFVARCGGRISGDHRADGLHPRACRSA